MLSYILLYFISQAPTKKKKKHNEKLNQGLGCYSLRNPIKACSYGKNVQVLQLPGRFYKLSFMTAKSLPALKRNNWDTLTARWKGRL